MSEFYKLEIDKCIKDGDIDKFVDIAMMTGGLMNGYFAPTNKAILSDVTNKGYVKGQTFMHKIYVNALLLYYEKYGIVETDQKLTSAKLMQNIDSFGIAGLEKTDEYENDEGYLRRIRELVSLVNKDIDKDARIVSIFGFIKAFYPKLHIDGLTIPIQYKDDAEFLLNNNSDIKFKEMSFVDVAEFFGKLNEAIIRDCLHKDRSFYFSYDTNIIRIMKNSMRLNGRRPCLTVTSELDGREFKMVRHNYKSMYNILSSFFSETMRAVEVEATMYLLYILHPAKKLEDLEALIGLWSIKAKEIKVVERN